MERARAILTSNFGFKEFRLSQAQVIERLLVENRNCLVLYPTGGGKSLCYQIPGLCLPGLTLVISPLIALMKDQVDALRVKGVSASSLDSSLSLEETRTVKDSIRNGSLKILYIAPERLNNESFIEMMNGISISLLAVDESHCISQWGASFRPEYLKIARFTEEHNVGRILCLTATATLETSSDICKSFHIDENRGVFRIPVYRPNLTLLVKTATNLQSKLDQVIPTLEARTGPAIVYVTLQKQAEDIALILKKSGISADAYHAGLKTEERKRVQDAFALSQDGVVVATIAFGMGIDKNNIRQVIHLNMPKTLENYSQEVGRAGRDGLPSTCILFLCVEDVPVLEGFARGDTCSKTSLGLWLGGVMLTKPDPDGALSFNMYEQGRDYDIRANVLNLLYAELELKHGFIRATTPLYQIYDLTPRKEDAHTRLSRDKSPAAAATFKSLRPKKTGWQIDIVEASTTQWPREAIVAQINAWEAAGLVDVKGSQVRARFKLLKPFPKDTVGQEAIIEKMYNGMVAREEDAIRRLHKVIEVATTEDCLWKGAAEYFGDRKCIPNGGKCGHCTYCMTLHAPKFTDKMNTVADSARLQLVLDACPDRDDPRLLARLAFGISSPRLTAAKLTSTKCPAYGCMVDVDFNVLLDAFTKACNDAGNRPAVVGTSTVRSTTKRATTGGVKRSGESTGASRQINAKRSRIVH